MIASLRGKILEKQPTRLVIETGGVGLEVAVPIVTSQALGGVGSEVFLHTALIVREDALNLYGFGSLEERRFFLKLIGVSGVGPKIALSALSGSSLGDLVAALRAGDITVLTRLPGIGKKTAERMVVELRDAMIEFEDASAPASRIQNDAVAALLSLGYTRGAAEKAVAAAAKRMEETEPPVEAVLRSALASLSSGA